MYGLCGAMCTGCENLESKKCKGCIASNGCPNGKKCWIYKYIEVGGLDNFNKFKKELIKEINSLNIEGMPKIDELYCLNGSYVNLEYTLPSNKKVKYLADDEMYLGTQVESLFDNKTCFGVVANTNFILVCTYLEEGNNPELIIYKKR